jgi:hypothetical protein
MFLISLIGISNHLLRGGFGVKLWAGRELEMELRIHLASDDFFLLKGAEARVHFEDSRNENLGNLDKQDLN